jgi:hypothetical protein
LQELCTNQKAEIERLKDEFKTDYRNSWKNKFFGVLEENRELQEQVDELLRDKGFLIAERTHIKEQAVKDTAKEICEMIDRTCISSKGYLCRMILKRYVVEVE